MILPQHLRALFFSLSILFLFFSCSPQDDDALDHSLVTVKLGATLSTYNALNIDIQEIQLQIMEDETLPGAWLSLKTKNTGIHDLTILNGEDVIVLVDFEQVPSNFIYSVKVIYGDDNSATKGGVIYDLEINESMGNASTNLVERQFEENILYELTLEMDLEASIEWSSENDPNFEPKTSTLMRQFNLF